MAKTVAHARRKDLRALLALALSSVSTLALNAEAAAQSYSSRSAASARDYDIPAQPISSALLSFAEQTGVEIIFSQDEVAGMISRPVHGRFSPDAALTALLPEGAPRIELAGGRVVRLDPQSPQSALNGEAAGDEADLVVTGTDNPHTHIVLRGALQDGRDLIIPRDFVQHGFRSAARDAASERLGRRSRDDARRALQREAIHHGPTRLDRVIEAQLDERRQIRVAELAAPNRSADMTDALKTRARELKNLGLAIEVRRNVLEFEPGWRDALKAMELHLDIRKSLMQARAQEASRAKATPERSQGKGSHSPFRFGF